MTIKTSVNTSSQIVYDMFERVIERWLTKIACVIVVRFLDKAENVQMVSRRREALECKNGTTIFYGGRSAHDDFNKR